MFLLQLLIWWCLGFLGGSLAARKGYSPIVGIVLALACGPFGLMIALILPRTQYGRELKSFENQLEADLRVARKNKTCPTCGCVHSQINRFCPSCMYRYPLEESPAEA
jgi:hypothetical protein